MVAYPLREISQPANKTFLPFNLARARFPKTNNTPNEPDIKITFIAMYAKERLFGLEPAIESIRAPGSARYKEDCEKISARKCPDFR